MEVRSYPLGVWVGMGGEERQEVGLGGSLSMVRVRCGTDMTGHPGRHVGFVPERGLDWRGRARNFFSCMLAKVHGVSQMFQGMHRV